MFVNEADWLYLGPGRIWPPCITTGLLSLTVSLLLNRITNRSLEDTKNVLFVRHTIYYWCLYNRNFYFHNRHWKQQKMHHRSVRSWKNTRRPSCGTTVIPLPSRQLFTLLPIYQVDIEGQGDIEGQVDIEGLCCACINGFLANKTYKCISKMLCAKVPFVF